MEKIFNNEGYMKDRLKRAKTDRVFYDLPDIEVDEKGAIYDKGIVRIQTLAEFEEYCAKHQAVVGFLMENYPKVVADIYKNAMTELSDPKAETNISKILSGKKVKSNLVYQTAYAPSARSAVRGFLNTINTKNAGVKGVDVELPKFKKTKKQIMRMFEKNKEGYFVPEINAEGLVVSKDGGKFSTNFVAIPASEITKEQLLEYFKAPYGDKADEMGIDFEDIIALSKQAYGEIGSPSVAGVVSVLVDTCAENYPLSLPSYKVGAEPVESEPVAVPAEESSDSLDEVIMDHDEVLDLIASSDEEAPVEIPIEEAPAEEETIDEIRIEGDGSSIKPGVEDGELVVRVTPEDGMVYRYEFVSASRIKSANGNPAKGSRMKKVLRVRAEAEPSERE